MRFLILIIVTALVGIMLSSCSKEESNQVAPNGIIQDGVYSDGQGHSFNIQVYYNKFCYWDYKIAKGASGNAGYIPMYPENGVIILYDQHLPNEYQLVVPPGPSIHGYAFILKFVGSDILYSSVNITEDNIWIYKHTDVVFSKSNNVRPLDIKTYRMDGLTLDYFYLTKDKITVSYIDTGNVTGDLPKDIAWVFIGDTIFNAQYGFDNNQPWGNLHHVKGTNNTYYFDSVQPWFRKHSSIRFPHPDTLIYEAVDSTFYRANQYHSYKGYRVN